MDDVFIFAKDESTAKLVYEYFADSLLSFNLHTNSAKSLRIARPFFTPKSRIIREASDSANEFLKKFLIDDEEMQSMVPVKVYYPWRLTRSYIRKVKEICSYNESGYGEVSSYLISVFNERIKKLANVEVAGASEEKLANYRDAALILLDVLYFLYDVAPSVSASYKLCTSTIVLVRFFEKQVPRHDECIRQRVYELTDRMLQNSVRSATSGVDNYVSLESVNLVLAMRELGDRYRLPETTVSKLFLGKGRLTYFDAIACLFYVRGDECYKKIRRRIVRGIDLELRDLSDIFMNSEKACLFLDATACPYIGVEQRTLWLSNFFSLIRKPLPTRASLDDFFAATSLKSWFVNWKEVDLLNALEKKELRQAY